LRDDLGVELEERDFAKIPLSTSELEEIFRGRDPRELLNPKSPVFKAKGLEGRKLTPAQALKLIAEDARILKRPIVIVGGTMLAGFDRDALRKALL